MDIPAGVDLCHSNRAFKVLLFLEADHKLTLEGRSSIVIRSGDLLVQPLAIDQIYSAVRRGAASRIHVMRFLFDLPLPDGKKREKLRGNTHETLRNFLKNNLSEVIHLSQFITLPVQRQIARIREEIETCRPGYHLEVSNMVFSLLIELIRMRSPSLSGVAKSSSKKSENAVSRAKQYIAENFASPLTLEQVAWHVRLSREHLARLFQVVSGQTVFDYLAGQRLEAAKVHLCNPNLAVTEVARRSGFSSSSLFCRTFKKATKVTPLQYRLRRMSEARFSPSKYAKTMAVRSARVDLF